jgi:hypothetical protein
MVEIHPETNTGRRRRPDFLVKPPKADRFYLEAIIATDESMNDSAASARIKRVFDQLNEKLNSPDFWIGMKLHGAPKTPPKVKNIKRFLEGHLADLNPDEINKVLESRGIDALPHWSYEHDGWEITFFPVPKSTKSRGKSNHRPLGIEIFEPRWIDSRVAVREAIVSKAGRYGHLGLPFIVAVNALGEHIDQIGIMEALFGKEQFIFRLTKSGPTEPKFSRIPDGVWTSKSGPRYTRISAVLLATQLFPWNILKADVCLYHNPWAKHKYDSELTRLNQRIPDANRLKFAGGESLGVIFGLSSEWPWED